MDKFTFELDYVEKSTLEDFLLEFLPNVKERIDVYASILEKCPDNRSALISLETNENMYICINKIFAKLFHL